MNVKQALEYGVNKLKNAKIDESIQKSRILLSSILNKPKEYLISHDLKELDVMQEKIFKKGIEKLEKHIPLQYITKSKEFMGLKFFIDENVLVPRADTEILVEEVIEISRKITGNLQILDLCTGSGAIAISLAEYIKNSTVIGTDIMPEVLKTAEINTKKINKQNQVKFIRSDLFKNVPEKEFDIIVSNPPYIKEDALEELPEEVKNEPFFALCGGSDGLYFYKEITNKAYNYLKKDGFLCFEIGYDQKEEVMELIEKTKKYKEIYSKKDLNGNDRIIICKKI